MLYKHNILIAGRIRDWVTVRHSKPMANELPEVELKRLLNVPAFLIHHSSLVTHHQTRPKSEYTPLPDVYPSAMLCAMTYSQEQH